MIGIKVSAMVIVSLRIRITFVILLVFVFAPAANAANEPAISAEAVRAWLAALREPLEEPQERPAAWTAAYNGLRKIGPDDRAILTELIADLDDANSRVRAIAAEAIGNIGPEAKAAVPKLRGLLPKTDDPENVQDDVVTAVVIALGQIGDDAVDDGEDDSVDATDELVLCFRTEFYLRAQQSLLRMGSAAVPAVVRGLKNAQPCIREGCLSLLGKLNCPELLDWEPQIDLLGDQAESFHRMGCSGWSVRVGRAATDSLSKFGPPIVPRLRKLLESSDPVVRVRAASILARLKVFDHSIADRLVVALRSADIASEAVEVIQRTKRATDPAMLARLRSLLKASDLGVRSRAAVALTDFGAVDADVLRVHIQRLSDAQNADEAADTLSRRADQLKPLEHELAEAAMHGGPYQVRWLAAGLLASVAPEHPAVASNLRDLRNRLPSSDDHEKRFEIQAAFLIGEKGLPTIFEELKRGERLGYGSPPKPIEQAVISELLRAAQDPDRNWNYVSRLIEVASRKPFADVLFPCLPILIAHLPRSGKSPLEPGPEAAQCCVIACGKPAVPTLIRVLRDPKTSEELRSAIVECLGQMGPAAREALPVLASKDLSKLLDSPWEVTKAIKNIGPSVECLPVLIESLDEFLAGDDAQEAILALGERARSEALKLLESDNAARRKMAVRLFVSLGPRAQASIPAIVEILRRRAGNDVNLMQILASLGPAAIEATPIVAERLESPHVRVRSAACITLARIAGSDARVGKSAIARLSAATDDSFAEVRAAAADAIGLVAPQAGGARAAIERLRSDRFATVRHAAERAIQAMDKHRLPPDRIWANYFDPFGPATGASLATEMAAGDGE
jgi:HEAT repeat protein